MPRTPLAALDLLRAGAGGRRGTAEVLPSEHHRADPQAGAGFDLRAAELAAQRQALGKDADSEKLAAVKEAQRDLFAERAEALQAMRPDGQTRRIEVKGRAGRDGIHMEANEWKQACHLEENYWLYVVFDCVTAKPELLRVQDPFHKLLANRQESAVFAIAASTVVEAAQGD